MCYSYYVFLTCASILCSQEDPKKKDNNKSTAKTARPLTSPKPAVAGGGLSKSIGDYALGQSRDRGFQPIGSRNALQNVKNADFYQRRPVGSLPQQQRFFSPRLTKKIPSRSSNGPRTKSRRLVPKKVSGMFNSKVGLKLGKL